MARAIVRYSCNNTGGKYKADKARADLRKILNDTGFKRVGKQSRGTASWERTGASTKVIGGALIQVFTVIEGLAPGVLDHVWVYCDE